MKKLIFIVLISHCVSQFSNAQTLSLCKSTDSFGNSTVTVSGGTGPYNWYDLYPYSTLLTEAECTAHSASWTPDGCYPSWDQASWDWSVLVYSGATTNTPNKDLKIVDANGNAIIYYWFNSNLPLCSALNIENNTVFSNVSVFPNPTQGVVNINFGDLKNIEVKVFNSIGQLVYQNKIINSSNYKFNLDVMAGIYLLELSTEKQKKHFKLIKK